MPRQLLDEIFADEESDFNPEVEEDERTKLDSNTITVSVISEYTCAWITFPPSSELQNPNPSGWDR